jgi:hypothetical protein
MSEAEIEKPLPLTVVIPGGTVTGEENGPQDPLRTYVGDPLPGHTLVMRPPAGSTTGAPGAIVVVGCVVVVVVVVVIVVALAAAGGGVTVKVVVAWR